MVITVTAKKIINKKNIYIYIYIYIYKTIINLSNVTKTIVILLQINEYNNKNKKHIGKNRGKNNS